MLGIGIDFGTSNSSVALYDGERIEYLAIEADAPREVMPSALYLNRRLEARTGRRAIAEYMRENAERVVQLTRESVGEIEVTVSGGDEIQGPKDQGGAITDTYAVHAFTDRDMPGRLFRSVKRWLGDSAIERVRVFDARYRIVALLTPMLGRLHGEAVRAAAGRSHGVFVGRPVRFEGRGDDAERVAVARLRESYGYAGLADPTLYPEPIAAVQSYLHRVPARPGEKLLAFDFGGGTLDLTVVRAEGEQLEILSTHGVGLGGDAIDRLIYRAWLFPELGEGARVPTPVGDGLKPLPFPFSQFAERLLNWPLAYELNRPDLRELIVQGSRAGGEAGQRLARLHELVTRNLAYRAFQTIERAKLELSERESARLELPELDLELAITRDDFETLLGPMLEEIRDCVNSALSRAGVGPDDISVVVRTGGSSRIPAVIAALGEIFPGRVVEHDAFTGIAAGLAIASYRSRRRGAL
jgi:hypothetical chaperone protein